MSDTVDVYYEEQPEPQRTTLLAVRSSIQRVLPCAQESISYSMPTFKIDGTAVAGIAGFKQPCSYFAYAGEVLELHAEALRSYDQNKGTLRFPVDAPLPLSLLRKMLATRLELEHTPVETGKGRRFYANGFVQSKGSCGTEKCTEHGSGFAKTAHSCAPVTSRTAPKSAPGKPGTTTARSCVVLLLLGDGFSRQGKPAEVACYD